MPRGDSDVVLSGSPGSPPRSKDAEFLELAGIICSTPGATLAVRAWMGLLLEWDRVPRRLRTAVRNTRFLIATMTTKADAARNTDVNPFPAKPPRYIVKGTYTPSIRRHTLSCLKQKN